MPEAPGFVIIFTVFMSKYPLEGSFHLQLIFPYFINTFCERLSVILWKSMESIVMHMEINHWSLDRSNMYKKTNIHTF